ncbi:MAG TPA: AAA family ATPase, partial [Methylomirabilota bacterium]
MALDAIRDQAEAVEVLRRAIGSGRVAHAWAFIGPNGVGRRTTALAFARALVAPSGGAAAGRVDRGLHPDVHLVGPTPPVSNPKGTAAIRVDNIRELERLAALKPAEAPWKVFIVDEAETMTGAAPQAFLKTLEEPPARTVIILILNQARALPATVLSRCQIVRFRPRAADGVVALLPPGAGPERE